ncbi:SemiSWEET family sugar transporter [candidate division KSB1 bacterium]
MVHASKGFHHFHKRKRVHEKLEPYPHPQKLKRFMDKAIYVGGVLGPIMILPQIAKIWLDKNASGVSLISWIAFLIGAVFWLAYGILHKEKPIIFTYGIFIVMDAFVVLGTVMYA